MPIGDIPAFSACSQNKTFSRWIQFSVTQSEEEIAWTGTRWCRKIWKHSSRLAEIPEGIFFLLLLKKLNFEFEDAALHTAAESPPQHQEDQYPHRRPVLQRPSWPDQPSSEHVYSQRAAWAWSGAPGWSETRNTSRLLLWDTFCFWVWVRAQERQTPRTTTTRRRAGTHVGRPQRRLRLVMKSQQPSDERENVLGARRKLDSAQELQAESLSCRTGFQEVSLPEFHPGQPWRSSDSLLHSGTKKQKTNERVAPESFRQQRLGFWNLSEQHQTRNLRAFLEQTRDAGNASALILRS